MTKARGNQSGGTEQEVPPPDKTPDAPDTPLELGKTGWRDLLKRSFKEFKTDRCSMTAGAWPTTGSCPCSRR
jgi:hypothetical protein